MLLPWTIMQGQRAGCDRSLTTASLVFFLGATACKLRRVAHRMSCVVSFQISGHAEITPKLEGGAAGKGRVALWRVALHSQISNAAAM
jgi:hypothetical protein